MEGRRRETERGKPYDVTGLVFPTRVDESFPSIAVALALLLVNRYFFFERETWTLLIT
jgi:hypothetical protein